VHRNPEHRKVISPPKWTWRFAFPIRLSSCFILVFLASTVVGMENCRQLIWVTNGIAISHLLLAPRWRWKYYFAVIFVGMLAAGFLFVYPGSWIDSLTHTMLNLGEVALAVFALRNRSTDLPHFTDQHYLLRFAVYAVLGAPAAVAIPFVFKTWASTGQFPWTLFLNWISTDGLGTAIITPACVSILQSRLSVHRKWNRDWFLVLALVPITIVAFSQSQLPAIFLIYPTVALILFRFGMDWAALCSLFVTLAGSVFTIHGFGPFAGIGPAISSSPTVLLQLYLASGMFLVFAAGSVMETLRATEKRLSDIVYLHDLVTENSRDAIILADFHGRRSYVSSAAAHWGGWGREQLIGMTSLELVHPEDRPKAQAIVRSLQSGGDGSLIECRIRTVSGEYKWVEANLRPVREAITGRPIGILNVVREISERKQAEQALKKAYAALESLAVTDALTGLPNRRYFDHSLASEWRRCMRDGFPLSLLLIDADWFKSYNDTYGHLRGDSCLKQIGESALDEVTRPGDLVARIGGEEFAIILPNTSNEGALQLADMIRTSLRHRKLLHNSNPTGYVTDIDRMRNRRPHRRSAIQNLDAAGRRSPLCREASRSRSGDECRRRHSERRNPARKLTRVPHQNENGSRSSRR
jgi:diguanylate cyclase (GGDEF)-like protein/PAS domain S-box-containing protein